MTLPDRPEDYIHRVGRVGRAKHMGLAISLVSRKKEKVWYHQCQSRGKNCHNTKLVDEGGCAMWYDEMDLLHQIEARLGGIKVAELGANYLYGGTKVTYGQTRDDGKPTITLNAG